MSHTRKIIETEVFEYQLFLKYFSIREKCVSKVNPFWNVW